MAVSTADGAFPTWEAPELGLTRATISAIVLVALILGFCYYAAVMLAPKPRPVVIQVTQAQLTSLPKPAPPPPPPPPKVVPPPKPLPAITKPPPVVSKIVVPTKPPPPVHHQPPPRPMKRVIVSHPRPPTPVPQPPAPENTAPPTPKPAPPAPPAPRTDGIPIYGAQVHDIIQANQNVPPALATLGVSGTAYVRIIVAPNGSVIAASIARSSGNPLIDQTALDHARQAHLNPFNADMPTTDEAFLIPVEIDAAQGDQGD